MAQGPKGDDDKLYSDRWDRMGRRLLHASTAVARMFVKPEVFVCTLTSIRVKFPQDDMSPFMVVLKGEGDEGPVVAFYQADTYEDAVTGAVLAYEAKSLKWREDRPWGG